MRNDDISVCLCNLVSVTPWGACGTTAVALCPGIMRGKKSLPGMHTQCTL